MKRFDRLLVVVHGLCVVALGAALTQAACEPPQGPFCPTPAGLPPQACLPRLEWQLYAEGFTRAERQQLRDGSAMWEAASGGAVRFQWLEAPTIGAVSITKGRIMDPDVSSGSVGITRGAHAVVIDAEAIAPSVGLAGVAAHELGHVMGLHHSGRTDSLMYPLVHSCMRVTDEDLHALYERYGM